MNKGLKGVVFDCNVYLQAIISRSGVASRCLELVRDGRITLYVSPPILAEIEEVLYRPSLRELIPNQSVELLETFTQGIFSLSTTIYNIPPSFSFTRDPDDEPYLNLAIAADADYIVSRDNDLLDLMTDYSDEAKDFRRRFRQIKILDPVEFLRILEKDLSVKP